MVDFVFKDEFVAKPSEFIIKDPRTEQEWEFIRDDGQPIKGVLTVVGYESEEFVLAARKFGKCKKGQEVLLAFEATGAFDNENCFLMSKCIIGWEDNGFFSEPYTPDEALDLLSRPENIWLCVQLAEHLADRRNFFKKK